MVEIVASCGKTPAVLNKHFLHAGQIQEEEEKEAQETWQEKEKEGSISVGLRARLTAVA